MAARTLSRCTIVLMAASLLPILLAVTPGMRDIDLSRYGPAPAYWMLFWIVGVSAVGALVGIAALIAASRAGANRRLPIIGLVGNLIISIGFPLLIVWRHAVA